MKLTSFGSSRDLEDRSIPLWIAYFPNCIPKYDDFEHQKKKLGDLIYDGLNVETKVRDDWVYKRWPDEVLFEIKGNTSNTYDNGSSIFDCNADIYAIGFLLFNQLVNVSILKLDMFKGWLIQHKDLWIKPSKNSNTDGHYETEWRTVKRHHIPQSIFFNKFA